METTRRQILTDCLDLMSSALAANDVEAANRIAPTMWKMHRAGVEFWRLFKRNLPGHMAKDVDDYIRKEISICRSVQFALNKIKTAKNTAIKEKSEFL